jgi:hypothetical protein
LSPAKKSQRQPGERPFFALTMLTRRERQGFEEGMSCPLVYAIFSQRKEEPGDLVEHVGMENEKGPFLSPESADEVLSRD